MTTKTAKPDMREQLRGFMQRHSDVVASAPAPILAVHESAQPPLEVTPTRSKQTLASKPPKVLPAIVPSAGIRFTVRIEDPELQSVNKVIGRALQELCQRITVSDVLRIGLSRVGEKSPITMGEIAALRATDGRRSKPKA